MTKFQVMAPVIRAQKGEHRDLFEDLQKQGFIRARVDGQTYRLDEAPTLDRQMRHNIEVVVDRLVASPEIRPRLAESPAAGTTRAVLVRRIVIAPGAELSLETGHPLFRLVGSEDIIARAVAQALEHAAEELSLDH